MIDKSWIDKPLNSKEFLNGVKQFLDFAFSNSAMKPRDIYDMGEVNLMESQEPIMEDIPFCEQNVGNIEEVILSTLLKKNGNYVNEEGKSIAVSKNDNIAIVYKVFATC